MYPLGFEFLQYLGCAIEPSALNIDPMDIFLEHFVLEQAITLRSPAPGVVSSTGDLKYPTHE
jgi:hypothetical protein